MRLSHGVQDAGAAPGVGADAAIKPCCFSAIHGSVGMGHATIVMLSSASAMDLAPGITDATAGCTRMQASGRQELAQVMACHDQPSRRRDTMAVT